MTDYSSSNLVFRSSKWVLTGVFAMIASLACLAASPLLGSGEQALAESSSPLIAQSADGVLETQTGQMSVSQQDISLVPRKTKINNGFKYTAPKKTVIVTVPFKATVYHKSSDFRIASAKWTSSFSNNSAKLTITGHKQGSAIITISNSATTQKLRVKVSVGAYDMSVSLNSPLEKTYTKKNGTNGYYALSNFTLKNNTGERMTIDKKCVLKVWSRKNSDGTGAYVKKGNVETIRGLPITIASGKSKRVCYGEKTYIDSDGNPLDPDDEMSYFAKLAFTIKVGGAYRTYYTDMYGMITKEHNGRDF